ncbi:MAG: amidinotransferase, partial [Pricia sp.]|nr:amidinotransferase [Pricia sp.]
MLNPYIKDEISPLKSVVLGTAESSGPVPNPEEAYDPKSLEHILAGTYPKEKDMILEMDAFANVFEKYGVEVFRPKVIENCNQIFSRDIAFVIENKLIKANILPNREEEFEAILHVLEYIAPENILYPPESVHIEGGDVMPWNEYVFIGTYSGQDYPDYITARTNQQGVN